MVCPKCNKFVGTFDDTCQHCKEPLKGNPVKDYEKKAGQIVKDAEARADDIKEQIRSGFKEQSRSGGVKSKEGKIELSDLSSTKDCRDKNEFNGEKLSDQIVKDSRIDVTELTKIHELWLKVIRNRKEVKVKEMYHHVFGVPYVTGAEDYAPRASMTDFIYRMENGDCFTAPNSIEPYKTDKSPLTVNANARYREDNNRYEICLFDGYLNFLLGVEAYFVYKNEMILIDIIEQSYNNKGKLSAGDVLLIIYKNHDKTHRYRLDEKGLLNLIENAFLACFEVIAHELGHVCLGHCRLDLSANRDEETIRINERQADGFASAIINSFFNYSEDAKKAIFFAYVKNELVWTLKDRLLGNNEPTTHPLSEERLKNAIKNNAKLALELSITEEWVDEIVNKLLSKIKALP